LVGRSPEADAELQRAVAALDRELAADLELTGMFDQTKQAFVLEMAQWTIHAPTLERDVPDLHRFLADLYGRIPEAESAMERRGPANTLKDADRDIVQRWEGDAREGQRLLRGDLSPKPPRLTTGPSILLRLIARLLGRSVHT
jgi:hypothetical protein